MQAKKVPMELFQLSWCLHYELSFCKHTVLQDVDSERADCRTRHEWVSQHVATQ